MGIYVIRFVSVGGRYMSLVTLFGVLTLVFAVREWIRACFSPGRTRAWTLSLLCATPLVGGLGIQVRHDIPMTAGLLLWTAVMTRTRGFSAKLVTPDYLQLFVVVLLVSMRHNGLPTLVVAGVLSMFVRAIDRRRCLAAVATVGVGIFALTQATTASSGHQHSVEPVQLVEWAIADISCLVTRNDVTVPADDWNLLERIASRSDWPRREACRFLNPLYAAPTFNRSAATDHALGLLRVWGALAAANPLAMIQVHFQRTRLFLPPFTTGLPSK